MACVKASLDAGITTFDTADAYSGGASEVATGKLVQLLPGYTLPAWSLDAVSTAFRGALPNVRTFIAFLAERLG